MAVLTITYYNFLFYPYFSELQIKMPCDNMYKNVISTSNAVRLNAALNILF